MSAVNTMSIFYSFNITVMIDPGKLRNPLLSIISKAVILEAMRTGSWTMERDLNCKEKGTFTELWGLPVQR